MRTSFPLLLLGARSILAAANAKWELYANYGDTPAVAYGRLDPIIYPGVVSQHVHMLNGANAIQSTYDYNTIRSESTCTNLQVQEDLSNYWSPAMYHYDGASNFSLMLSTGFHVYYWQTTFSYDANNPNGDDTRVPFPEGWTMIAGNPYQRSVNLSDPASAAAIFNCDRKSGNSPWSHDFRDFQRSGLNCDNQLIATLDFPSCWDGLTQANTTDFSHAAYPAKYFSDGHYVCPESHPHALMHLNYEWYWPVNDFPFDPTREDNWVLANGDTSGYGFHGDFSNGWDTTLLADAIEQCNSYNIGIENCAPFAQWNHAAAVPPCMPSGTYPDETVGLEGHSLTALPGCNPLWTDNSTKPDCTPEPATPPLDVNLGPDLSEWNYLACPLGATSAGILLSAYQYVSNNMTVDMCLQTCQDKGYTLAGLSPTYDFCLTPQVADTITCYCDNALQNGGQAVSDQVFSCNQRCPGDFLEWCGGCGSLQLYEACSGTGCHANAAFAVSSTATTKTTAAATKSLVARMTSSAVFTSSLATTTEPATTTASPETSTLSLSSSDTETKHARTHRHSHRSARHNAHAI